MAMISKKRSSIPNYKFEPEENVDIIVDLKTVVRNMNVNKFLKL
jgi:succinylglutamate desuccinylase